MLFAFSFYLMTLLFRWILYPPPPVPSKLYPFTQFTSFAKHPKIRRIQVRKFIKPSRSASRRYSIQVQCNVYIVGMRKLFVTSSEAFLWTWASDKYSVSIVYNSLPLESLRFRPIHVFLLPNFCSLTRSWHFKDPCPLLSPLSWFPSIFQFLHFLQNNNYYKKRLLF
jgi:hypothetical protein